MQVDRLGPFCQSHPITPPKQTRSSSIFHVRRRNTNDSSFGYSVFGDHMADMIIATTDRLKVTLADGGWQQASSASPIRLSSIITMAINSAVAKCGFNPFLLLLPIRHKDPGRTLEEPSTGYRRYRHVKFPCLQPGSRRLS